MKVEVISTRRITEALIRQAEQPPPSWWQRLAAAIRLQGRKQRTV